MPGKRQAGVASLLVTYLLLRVSCPPPFGPALPFAPVPDGRVATAETSDSRAAGARKLWHLGLHHSLDAVQSLDPCLRRDDEM